MKTNPISKFLRVVGDFISPPPSELVLAVVAELKTTPDNFVVGLVAESERQQYPVVEITFNDGTPAAGMKVCFVPDKMWIQLPSGKVIRLTRKERRVLDEAISLWAVFSVSELPK